MPIHKYLILFLCVPIFFAFSSCEGEEPTIHQIEGTYVGKAKVLSRKTVVGPTQSSTTVIFDGEISDTFIIKVLDREARKYSIERSKYSGDLYDIGNPDFEYILEEDFTWHSGYRYDRNWISRLDLSVPDQLEGYMLDEDLTGSKEYDSQGNITTTYYFYEYEIRAIRQ